MTGIGKQQELKLYYNTGVIIIVAVTDVETTITKHYSFFKVKGHTLFNAHARTATITELSLMNITDEHAVLIRCNTMSYTTLK